MVDYKIIKTCYMCKKKFTVMKGQNSRRYCDECQEKIDQQNQSEADSE